MRKQKILRTLLFIVFFSIGATALSGSILCDDLVRYYHNRQQLKAKEELSNRLKSLNIDYDALLQNLEKDPNLFERIASLVLGTERNDANTIYPKATEELLEAVKKALEEDSSQQSTEPVMPDWLVRCSEPRRRVILFLAGVFLVLISFICLGSAKSARADQEEP
jgi:hypothetical protein